MQSTLQSYKIHFFRRKTKVDYAVEKAQLTLVLLETKLAAELLQPLTQPARNSDYPCQTQQNPSQKPPPQQHQLLLTQRRGANYSVIALALERTPHGAKNKNKTNPERLLSTFEYAKLSH